MARRPNHGLFLGLTRGLALIAFAGSLGDGGSRGAPPGNPANAPITARPLDSQRIDPIPARNELHAGL